MQQFAKQTHGNRSRSRERGTGILEVVIAAAILLICSVGVLSLFAFTTGLNGSQGEDATRTTELSSDKLETLMTASFSSLAVGGGVVSGSPVPNYVEYLNQNGCTVVNCTGTTPVPSSNAIYIRQWQISANSSGNLKTITVITRMVYNVGGKGVAPSSKLVAIKANF